MSFKIDILRENMNNEKNVVWKISEIINDRVNRSNFLFLRGIIHNI